jgi:hypothetical protein
MTDTLLAIGLAACIGWLGLLLLIGLPIVYVAVWTMVQDRRAREREAERVARADFRRRQQQRFRAERARKA